MDSSAKETCQYIAETTAELARMASGSKLKDLALLLEMERLEAENRIIGAQAPKAAYGPIGDKQNGGEKLVASAP